MNGEHEEVWQILIELGDSVRNEPMYTEANQVAVETMKRVRKNVETLHERLDKIKFLDKHQGLSFEPPAPNVETELAKIEGKIGILPISIRAFCEHVGTVRFLGSLKKTSKVNCDYPDPLYFDLLKYIWNDFDAWEVDWEEDCDPLSASFAPDSYHKADVSGGSPYSITVPDLGADARVMCDDYNDLYFVQYLRMCFNCGGLPGLSVKYKSFATDLSKDLLPF